ncbi:TIR-like protein FxsC [Streptomyces sp.]|uniref:TIR-like protein FxsC n=1 Tax=Streptomyces sp. TaxID=1931 RepID=UPI002D78B935|nr:TIR-like protein FxsC [Streptomyces sp.]HET6355897.1 TIR-like protein FxsC [Streptomyces sp.]
MPDAFHEVPAQGPAESGTAPSDLAALGSVVRALHGLDRDLDGVSVADLLWLAAGMQGREGGVGGGTARISAGSPPADPRERLTGWDPLNRPLYEPSAGGSGAVLPAREVSLPRGTALPRARELATALRPLRRQWLAGRRQQLDVEATVSDYARTGELLPAFRPTPERWFDLTVVLDRSPTMAVWKDTVDELLRVLSRTGVFRTLRIREVDTWKAGFEQHGSQGRPERAGTRTSQPRRLVLVVSDCVSGTGGDNQLWDMIHHWAGAISTVLVNPLPPKIWRHSGLDLPAVRVTPPAVPGVRNTQLRFGLPTLMEDEFNDMPGRRDAWLPVPVVGLSPRAVGKWARTLMRGDPDGCEAVLVPEPGLLDRSPRHLGMSPDGAQLVEAFLHRASPAAVRLAALCSSYSRMNVAVLHLIRQELVPEATTADMAEVVVGGLVSIVVGGSGHRDPVLQFREGVRERLAPRLGARDATRTRDAVSGFIAAHPSARPGFPGLVADPEGDTAMASGLAPFAEASAQTLSALGVPVAEPESAAGEGPDRAPGRSIALDTAYEVNEARPVKRAPVVERTADHRPYFFLSYAHTPQYGTGGADPDMWVERFFRDLCGHVMAMTDLPSGAQAGFMDREIRSGEGWSERLGEVLATCRVFVPLYSPRYFASETCGKEWYAFAQRAIYHQAKSNRPAEAIVPALWVPIPPEQLPGPAERLQFNHRAFGDRYITDGLYGLIKLRIFAEEYDRAVYELAKRVVSVAETVNVGPGSPVDYRQAPNAFGTPTGGPRRVRIAVVAPTVRDLPAGRNPDYYGLKPDHWNPYYPDSARPLAHVAADMAYAQNYEAFVSSFDEELASIDAGSAPSEPLILFVDRWALEDPAQRARLAAIDAMSLPWVSVVVPWNRDDPQSRMAEAQLTATMERTIPSMQLQGRTSIRAAAHGVLSIQALGQLLPQVMEAVYQMYLRSATVYPPATDARHTDRPRLRGPLGTEYKGSGVPAEDSEDR